MHDARPQQTEALPSARRRRGQTLRPRLDSTQNDVVSESEPSFEVIAHESVRAPDGFQYNDWRCHSIPMPPCRPTNISSYDVVGNSDIWVSADDEATYSFDTSGGAWVKKGD